MISTPVNKLKGLPKKIPMASNETAIPFPIFNKQTIADYPSIIFCFLYSSVTAVISVSGMVYFMYKTPFNVRSTTETAILVMTVLFLVREATLILQFTTEYSLIMSILANWSFGVGSLMLLCVTLDFSIIFSTIISIKWLKKAHTMHYKVGFTFFNIAMLWSWYLPMIESIPQMVTLNNARHQDY